MYTYIHTYIRQAGGNTDMVTDEVTGHNRPRNAQGPVSRLMGGDDDNYMSTCYTYTHTYIHMVTTAPETLRALCLDSWAAMTTTI